MPHGSHLNPANRFERIRCEVDDATLDQWVGDVQEWHEAIDGPRRDIQFIEDDSQSILSEKRSPDIPFRYSVNPYRGSIHTCAYCYARPTHEYLGYNAGLDFQTRIVVKRRAAELLRSKLGEKSWAAEPIVFSGVTDCYQPAERQFRLTRQCLEVAVECRQPIGMITKNALVLRDGQLSRGQFKERMIGTGVLAEQIRAMFLLFRQKQGLAAQLPDFNRNAFRPARPKDGQLWLF